MYLDDIISFGTTFGDALDNLTFIFELLRTYGLQLKSTMCHLFQTSVPFLGHVVGRCGLECDPKKIEDVKSWPVPDCLKSVRQLLGFVGYYRRFIPRFADLAEPLVALTGKDVPFVWRPECAAESVGDSEDAVPPYDGRGVFARPPVGRDCTMLRLSISNFRWDRGCSVITLRRPKRNWDLPG